MQHPSTEIWDHQGNRFVMIAGAIKSSHEVQEHCKQTGVDGLVCYEVQCKSLIVKKFFNNDGSLAAYCGNAHLCLGMLAYRLGVKKVLFAKHVLYTKALAQGLYAHTLSPFDWKSVSLKKLSLSTFEGMNPIGIQSDVFLLTFGVPHLVFLIESHLRDSLLSGRLIQQGDLLNIQASTNAPHGVNLTFLFLTKQGRFDGSRTFERGCARFTSSCHSGVLASLIVLLKTGQIQEKTYLKWKSFEHPLTLRVEDKALSVITCAKQISLL